jgi:hypothetical protein
MDRDWLVALAEERGWKAHELMMAAGEEPDRLNNGRLAEAMTLLLDQDEPEWIAWLIESRVGMVQGVERTPDARRKTMSDRFPASLSSGG